MKRTVIGLVSDEELRAWLQARETVLLVGKDIEWRDVERQVERLGFGEDFVVCAAQARTSETATVRVEPVRPPIADAA